MHEPPRSASTAPDRVGFTTRCVAGASATGHRAIEIFGDAHAGEGNVELKDCWISYAIYYATGEGMHYAVAVAPTAERAKQLFDARASELLRGQSETASLGAALQDEPALRGVIPEEVHRRTGDPLCWTLEYFGMIDFNCG